MILKGVGEWEGTMTMYGMGPEPITIPAKESVTALGQFWTQSHFSCDFGGMAFEGSATSGYDPAKKKFVGTWIDNMSTAWVLGSTRTTIMVSARRPPTAVARNASASGASGSIESRASEPTRR